MKAGGEAQATRSQTGGHPIHGAGGRGWWRFVRRYLEMVPAMLVGMTVLRVNREAACSDNQA